MMNGSNHDEMKCSSLLRAHAEIDYFQSRQPLTDSIHRICRMYLMDFLKCPIPWFVSLISISGDAMKRMFWLLRLAGDQFYRRLCCWKMPTSDLVLAPYPHSWLCTCCKAHRPNSSHSLLVWIPLIAAAADGSQCDLPVVFGGI